PPRRRAAGAGVVAALVAGCSWMPLDRLIFFPDPDLPDRPPGVEERAITTADGLRLDAWWAGTPHAAATLVWSHGNGGNIGGCAGVAVVSASTTLRDAGRAHYGPLALLAGERFDSLARVRGLSVPIFVAHGERDEVVPFALGERLFAAAREPKRFFRVPGGHHN